MTGTAAGLVRGMPFAAAAGAYALSGQAVTLTYNTSPVLVAVQGGYALTGQGVTLDWSGFVDFGNAKAWIPIRFSARLDRLKNLDYPTLVTASATEADSNALWAKRNWPRIVRLRVKKVPIPLP